MKKHSGMRPQDILILMAIIVDSKAKKDNNEAGLNNKTIARSLKISESEVSESLYRSAYAGLINDIKNKDINKKALLDFLVHGIKFVFPTQPSGIGRGFATAHSALPIKKSIVSEENYVWQHPEGNLRGLIIEPLYKTVPDIIEQQPVLYELLTLIDAIRTGNSRVKKLAIEDISKRLLN